MTTTASRWLRLPWHDTIPPYQEPKPLNDAEIMQHAYQVMRPGLRQLTIDLMKHPRCIGDFELDMYVDQACKAMVLVQTKRPRMAGYAFTVEQFLENKAECWTAIRNMAFRFCLEPIKWREFTKANLGRANKPLRGKRRKTMLQPLPNK